MAQTMESQIEIYQTSDNQLHITVRFERDSVWLGNFNLAICFKQTEPLHFDFLQKFEIKYDERYLFDWLH
jgi:hypothetical protein